MPKRILIVDDEESMRDTMEIMLKKEGFDVGSAESGAKALERIGQEDYDLVITDLKMPGMSGIELIEQLIEQSPGISIIVMTAYATKGQAITALNLGASFFIEKPFKKPELLNYINRSLKMDDLIRENKSLKRSIAGTTGIDAIIGTSAEISTVKDLIRKVAATESTVLITGDSGTGKEMVARALHDLSSRAEGAFVAINCGARPSELLESELFGHVKGSFTGAVRDKVGLMEHANGGTFFLDEVGNTELSIQVKILRAIQEREILPVGGQTPRKVSLRLIAATNEDLEDSIDRGEFRKDLYYRLNVINVQIPPLRERAEDIELLFTHFLREKGYGDRIDKDGIPRDVLKYLNDYEWPGNIRELENVVERICALVGTGNISVNLLPDHIREPRTEKLVEASDHETPSMDDIEKAYIHWVLTQQNGQKQRAAEILGIGRSTLDRKIEKYGLDMG